MQHPPADESGSALVAQQGDILMKRLQELDRSLGVQEWWMLGRDIAEAATLSEVVSLLAVARAELDQVLVDFCGRATAPSPSASDSSASDSAPQMPDPSDTTRLSRQRAIASQLLQMLGMALPPTIDFARQLRPFAQFHGMPAPGLDTLAIVANRLEEAFEALQYRR
jgi:hypothetical protein